MAKRRANTHDVQDAQAYELLAQPHPQPPLRLDLTLNSRTGSPFVGSTTSLTHVGSTSIWKTCEGSPLQLLNPTANPTANPTCQPNIRSQPQGQNPTQRMKLSTQPSIRHLNTTFDSSCQPKFQLKLRIQVSEVDVFRMWLSYCTPFKTLTKIWGRESVDFKYTGLLLTNPSLRPNRTVSPWKPD
jgi:hypothetical protein